jgi:2-polyprenyl-3-methyl-5-hydroxy-6-metoxy-1,4-benzoquinol methylase
MSSEFWNQRYSTVEYIFGKHPNEFFRSVIGRFSVGTILFPGEGEGRNAVFAATQGWDVYAFDQSMEAKKKARQLAANYGVQIHYEVTDLKSFQPNQQYDLIGLFFFHLPSSVRAALHTRMGEWLKPGGSIILEAFTPEQLQYTSGGPSDPSMLYFTDLLKQDFSNYHMLHLEEGTTLLEEGPGHRGPAATIRMIAQKPNNQ